MGLLGKIKVLFQLKGLYDKVKEIKMTKGMKSTEFWVTVLASLQTVFQSIQGNLDPKMATIIGAVLACVYTVARSFVKANEAQQ